MGAVCNRVVDEPPVATIRDVLGAPVMSLAADPRVGRSVTEEMPVVDAAPGSEPAAALTGLARTVERCTEN